MTSLPLPALEMSLLAARLARGLASGAARLIATDA